MRRDATRWGTWVAGALCLAATGGCQSWFKPAGLPADPLFESRKPAESKAKLQPPHDVAFQEIVPPADPYNPYALVAYPPRVESHLPLIRTSP
jgi:hypothetical protein